MNQRRSVLDSVRVPQPCDVAWEAMRGEDAARLCVSCDRQVHDLASMTRREAESLVTNIRGSVCVRLTRRGGRTLTRDDAPLAVLHHIMRRPSPVAAGALTAVFALVPTSAQSGDVRQQPPATRRESAQRHGRVALTGTVYDIQRSVVVNARVELKDRKTGRVTQTATDDEGCYTFYSLPAGTYSILIA